MVPFSPACASLGIVLDRKQCSRVGFWVGSGCCRRRCSHEICASIGLMVV